MKAKSAGILFAIMVSLILANGLSMKHLLNWSFVEGVYFWFITFTTIGFGDYVLREPQRIKELTVNSSVNQANKNTSGATRGVTFAVFFGLIATFYYILSLCIVSSVLNAIMAAIEERKCRPRCPGCVPRKPQNHVDNDWQHTDTPEQCETNMTNLNLGNYGLQKDTMIRSLSVTELK